MGKDGQDVRLFPCVRAILIGRQTELDALPEGSTIVAVLNALRLLRYRQ